MINKLACVLLLTLSATATPIHWQDFAHGIAGWGGFGLAGSIQGGQSVNLPGMKGSVTNFSGSMTNLMTLATTVQSSAVGVSLIFNASGQWTQGSGLQLVFGKFGQGGITNLVTNIPGLTAANFFFGFSTGGSEKMFLNMSGLNFTNQSYVNFDVPQVALLPEPGTMVLLGTGLVACVWKKRAKLNWANRFRKMS